MFVLLTLLTSSKAIAATPCSLSFTVTSDKTSVTSGETLTRSFTLKNNGKTSCRDVAYSVYYSPNESFVSSNPVPKAGNYYFYVGNLNPNKQVSSSIITKQITASSETEIRTDACASATGAADACVDSVIPVIQASAGSGSAIIVPVTAGPVPVATSTPAVIASTTTAAPTPIVNKKEQGIWVWNFPSQMNTTLGNQQMDQLATNGFNAVYITVDDYLDIYGMPEGTAKNSAKSAYFTNLSKFVTKANSLGIAVDAEGGWRDWAQSANRWKGFALINMVKEYDVLYPNTKLRGFQYDVEPYLLPEYETNKAAVLTDFVGFIDQSVKLLAGTDVKFSISIPHFYDDAQAWTPAITYGGKTTYAFNHLLNVMEAHPGGSILLMSYRNFFDGPNGTKAISQTEVQEATNGGYSTSIIVGQETGNVDPAYTTFYGLTKAELFSNLSQIDSGFSSYSKYGGTAVDYVEPFLALK